MKKHFTRGAQTLLTGAVPLMLCATAAIAHTQDTVSALDGPQNLSVQMHGAVNAMAETCHVFSTGGVVSFSFSSKLPLDFNVHHHGESSTEFPVKLTDVANHEGQFLAKADHEYCFNWDNHTFSRERWRISLQFQVAAVESAAR